MKYLEFIKGFSQVQDFFLYGYCYWFANILVQRFPELQIYYLPIVNHFVAGTNNHYFDVSGEIIPNEEIYLWEDYKLTDPIHAKRIEKYCIRKE